MKTVSIKIEGMSCASCANSIEKEVASLDGVLKSSVNFAVETGKFDVQNDDITNLIKEKNLEINNIIRSSSLKDERLINVTIYEFDQNNNFTRRIEAESANISSLKWSLKNTKIIDKNIFKLPQMN